MKDLILHFFQAKAFPELASAVRARAGAVIRRWESAAREILPRADALTHEQLRDSLPATLERLAGALETTGPRPTAALLDESGEHGVDRAAQAYNLADLLVEFDLLRPILMEEAAVELGRDVTLGEIIALNMGVDLAARRSVLTFVQRQRADLEAGAKVQAKYLSFMSHDIRGGLNAILLSAEVLETELRDEPRFAQAMEDVDSIRRNILDTVAAMDRFLKAEQLRSGKVAAKRAVVDLRQLAAEVIMTARPQAAAKGLAVTLHGAESCVMETDRELVLTILQNLVGNAIKYTAKGEVRVEVVGRPAPETGCAIEVLDTGPGIAPERIEGLFAPFVRGETHGQSGVGLGLYIARQAADVLGATLDARSTPGVGTTFTFYVPG